MATTKAGYPYVVVHFPKPHAKLYKQLVKEAGKEKMSRVVRNLIQEAFNSRVK